jgi:hypothetical protein
MVFPIRVDSGITPDADSSYCGNDAPVSASLGFPVRGTDGASQRDRCGLATCTLNKIRTPTIRSARLLAASGEALDGMAGGVLFSGSTAP